MMSLVGVLGEDGECGCTARNKQLMFYSNTVMYLRLHSLGGYPSVNKVSCLLLLLSVILPQSDFSHVEIYLFDYCKHRLEWPIAIFNRLLKQI